MNFFFLAPSLTLNTSFFLSTKESLFLLPLLQIKDPSSGESKLLLPFLSYNVCNVRFLRVCHSDEESPGRTNRNGGSTALSSSSPPLPPFPLCSVSSGCPVVSALISCARHLGSNPKPTWRDLNPFQTFSGKTLRYSNFS